MTKRFRSFNELPLFAREEDIATALLGTGKNVLWRSVAPLLERRGLPKVDDLMGGRYTPAVKAFFDREYRIEAPYHVSAPDGPENFSGSWMKRNPRSRA